MILGTNSAPCVRVCDGCQGLSPGSKKTDKVARSSLRVRNGALNRRETDALRSA